MVPVFGDCELLARTYRTLGQVDEATLEERAGRATLERIGAKTLAGVFPSPIPDA